jgi:hypothetical protein
MKRWLIAQLIGLKEGLWQIFKSTLVIALIFVVLVAVSQPIIWLRGKIVGTSKIIVLTEPGGADIYINGKKKGSSLLNGRGEAITVHAGCYTLDAILPGAGAQKKQGRERNICVIEGSGVTVSIQLRDNSDGL